MLAFHSAIYYAIGQQKGDAGQHPVRVVGGDEHVY